ncbi:MAG: glucose 1-dehydrogenase [Betaproteobacteria bacterium]|nr:glucose 1-dehydrogenase [Betaproteobacteria bacterium]
MGRLGGTVVLVTGAARGIGAAIAMRVAKEGASVAVADLDVAGALAVADRIRSHAVEADGFAVDVREPEQSAALVERVVSRFGRLDVMVNNAGVIRVRTVLDTTPDDWDFIQSVNARGLFFAQQAGARQMLGQAPTGEGRPCGKIINLASIAGRVGRPMLSAYCASKATAISVTQAAAAELAPKVTVNAICPGPVDTEMWKQIDREWAEQKGRPLGSVWQERVDAIPMKRAETPEDLTGIAVFLASADSDFITGQSFHVDGGLMMM